MFLPYVTYATEQTHSVLTFHEKNHVNTLPPKLFLAQV